MGETKHDDRFLGNSAEKKKTIVHRCAELDMTVSILATGVSINGGTKILFPIKLF